MDAYVVGPVFSRSSPPGLLTFFLNKEKNYSLESLVRKFFLLFKCIYQQIPKWSTINNFLFFSGGFFSRPHVCFCCRGIPNGDALYVKMWKFIRWPIKGMLFYNSVNWSGFFNQDISQGKKICICPSICWKILILAILEVLFSTKCLRPPN